MKKYRYLIVDLDGVVWRGDKPIVENIEVLNKLRDKGVEIVFLTNNSSRSRIEYLDKLRSYGIETSIENIVSGGYLAAEYMKRQGSGNKVFVVGEAGLYYEIVKAGLVPVTIGSPADYVVVGLDRFLTYDKVRYASKLIREGATFIATNLDNVFPVESGVAPGAGSIVELIKVATGREPDMVTGKPSEWVLDFIINKYSVEPDKALVIGDRVDIDVLMGMRKGVDTLYVLTGVGKPSDPAKYGLNPTYTAKNLLEFYRKWEKLF